MQSTEWDVREAEEQNATKQNSTVRPKPCGNFIEKRHSSNKFRPLKLATVMTHTYLSGVATPSALSYSEGLT